MKGRNELQRGLSLFSGAGGMDIGVDDAGYDTVCAIESDVHCAATLCRNARHKTVWQVDVRAVSPERILEIFDIRPGGITLLYGSPPCQSPGQRTGRPCVQGNLGLLIREFVRFARVLRPTAILVEQLPAFLRSSSPNGQPLIEGLERAFARLGYDLHARVLNTAFHGVAQSRRRAIVVCVPTGQRFRFPNRAVSAPSVGEVLGGLPQPVTRGEEPLVPNHVDVTPPRDRERISFVPEGSWLARVPNVPSSVLMNLTNKDTTKFRRLDRKLTSLTIACGGIFFHPVEDRYITPREAARIQGFPDKHVLVGPIRGRSGQVRDLDQHRQVASAVPPPLATSVARSIAESLCLG